MTAFLSSKRNSLTRMRYLTGILIIADMPILLISAIPEGELIKRDFSHDCLPSIINYNGIL